MLSCLAHASRCLRQAHRSLRPYTPHTASSYSSEAILSASTTEQQPLPGWVPQRQDPETIPAKTMASKGQAHEPAAERTLSSVILTSTTTTRVAEQRLQRAQYLQTRRPLNSGNQRRLRKSRNNTLRFVGGYMPRAVPSSKALLRRHRSRLQQKKIRRMVSSDTGSEPQGENTRSLRKYLNTPRLVSLGSWAPSSEAPLLDAESHEPYQKLDSIDLTWSKRFMGLEESRRPKVKKTRNFGHFLHRYTILLHRSWLHVPKQDQILRWQDAMLWCMQKSPIRALAMLLATFRGRAFRPSRHMVQDCLQLLARHYLFDVSEADPTAKHAIWRLTLKFMDVACVDEPRSHAISQEVVQLLLKHCNKTLALLLYEKLVSNRANLHVNTMLHFLARFVDMGKVHLSMELLETITNRAVGTCSSFATGIDLSQGQIQAACVKLLRSQWGLGEPYPVQSKILAQMLEMGIRPNTAMYNAILLNMIEGRDFGTAWQTYDIARQSYHFATDAITYGILAKGAKLSGESSILERVLRAVDEDRSMLLRNPRLMTSILDAICHLSPGEQFTAMLEFYKQHFDLRPLQELGLCSLQTQAPDHADIAGKWPTKHTLGQMILVYNKFHAPDTLVHRYNLYQDFVQRQHPLIAPLAEDDYVANSFLMAFGRRPETLQYCTAVVKQMLSPPSSDDTAPHATPTVRTWSILLSAYMLHGQTQAAEKVLTMMRARGLKPDVVTWNSIISGYAAMQDAAGAVGGMRRMEAEGLRSNTRTLKELGRLRDRATLLTLLEESLESPTSVELKKLAKSEEVEAMAEGWEANVSSRNWEVQRYLQSFNERHM